VPPPPDWGAARVTHQETLAAPLSSPWTTLAGEAGDAARHVAANFLAVAEEQRAARSVAEGVSVAVSLPPDPSRGIRTASVWLDFLDLATGTATRPAIALRERSPHLVVLYRPPEGPDLAAVLESIEMAPIDDLSDTWQALPDATSARGQAIEALNDTSAGSLEELRSRLRSVLAP
jgi:hypothetical protein